MSEEKEIPGSWINCQIKEIGNIQTGTTPSKNNPSFYSREYPFYKPTDLEAGINVNNSIDGLSELGINQARYAPENSILVTCIGATIGKTGFVRKGGGFNQQINCITPNKSINPKYIYFQAISHYFQSQIIKNASATTLPILNKGRCEILEMSIAPLPEQHRIVAKIEEVFSSLDRGIENLKTAQDQLVVYRQAVLKWAFEGRLTNKDVKDGELPEGWKWKTIKEVCEMKAGFFVKASDINETFEMGLFPCYGGNGLRGYVKSTTHEGMFSLVGRQGALCGNVHLVNGKFHATEHAVVVSVKADIDIKWLYHKLISMKLNQHSTGTAQPGLSVNNLLLIEISVPTLPEQQLIVSEIESRLSVCDKIEESISISLLKAEALRQSILKKAFEGKLVLQDPNDEPASDLLKRIKDE